jgi:bacterioferritin-associated ferredoxin
MFICVCNAINDRSVREILANSPHVTTPAGVHRAAGCKPQCGRCLDSMAGMIADARSGEPFAAALQAAD